MAQRGQRSSGEACRCVASSARVRRPRHLHAAEHFFAALLPHVRAVGSRAIPPAGLSVWRKGEPPAAGTVLAMRFARTTKVAVHVPISGLRRSQDPFEVDTHVSRPISSKTVSSSKLYSSSTVYNMVYNLYCTPPLRMLSGTFIRSATLCFL